MMMYVALLILIALGRFKEPQHESPNPCIFLPTFLLMKGNIKAQLTHEDRYPILLIHSCNIPFS